MAGDSKKIIFLERVDSTNNYAMALIQKGLAVDKLAIIAKEQTEGKGRRSKTWQSSVGQSIIISILAQMQWLRVDQQFRLSVAVAMGCFDFFFTYFKNDLKIKWPNDIFINDSKAGGILIENQIRGNLWQWAVIGIGLNINQENFEGSKLNAISLKQVTGDDYDVIKLSNQLYNCIIKRINNLQEQKFDEMLSEYNQNLYALNKKVKLKKESEIFETQIKSVTAEGELITQDHVKRKFRFDEIEWIFTH